MDLDDLHIEVVDEAMAEVLRAKSGVGWLAISWGLWSSAQRMLIAYLMDKHPDWSADEIQAEVAKRMSHGERYRAFRLDVTHGLEVGCTLSLRPATPAS